MHPLLRKVLPIAAALLLVLFLPHPAQAARGKCEAPLVLDPLCEASKTVAGGAGKVVSAPFRYAANSAVDMVTSWVADTARWIVEKVMRLVDDSTSPNLDSSWFSERYRFMVGLAALVIVPLLLIATIRSIVVQDLSQLVRSFFVHLPLAVLGTFVAVFFIQALLVITDAMSAAAARSIAGDVSGIFDSAGDTLVTGRNPALPSFAIFFGGLLLILGSIFVWLELLIRSAGITVCVFFLPLILAGLVWPTTARWTSRLLHTLVALVLSKFVIVGVISLATAAMDEPARGGFSAVMGSAALMTMAAFSPFALFKLLPALEDGAMSQLQGLAHRPVAMARPGGPVANAISLVRHKSSSTEGGNDRLPVKGHQGSERAAPPKTTGPTAEFRRTEERLEKSSEETSKRPEGRSASAAKHSAPTTKKKRSSRKP